MIRLTGLTLPLGYTAETLRRAAAKTLCLPEKQILTCTPAKRAADARKKTAVHFVVTVDVTVDGDEQAVLRRANSPKAALFQPTVYVPPTTCRLRLPPVVVGSGPAGLFAALTLARAGARPLLLERGENVDARQKAVEAFRRTGVLNTDSNVQFGEGGAGTFSDGKLHTGIKDVRCRFVIEQFAAASDTPADDLLWQAQPHIGTDRLCGIIKNLRREIERLGGTVRFGCRVTDLIVKDGKLTGLTAVCEGKEEQIACERVVLAIGHSARDTMAMLARVLPAEKKPFAVGVRIEHPRRDIDRAQYGKFAGHPALGAAAYKLNVRPIGGRGVYTFCMCPGGEVIAAASEAGGIAVNGMSRQARDARNSNSALLCGVEPADLPDGDPLAGVALQREMEQAAFRLGGGDYRAPVQLCGDFLAGRASRALGEVQPSYRPGTTLCDLRECLPDFVAQSLRTALPLLGRQLAGFDRPDAVLTGVESRSSSPVRFLRDEAGQSAVRGVYPCGEGAGYAGGIVSAAVDGIRCAERVLQNP